MERGRRWELIEWLQENALALRWDQKQGPRHIKDAEDSRFYIIMRIFIPRRHRPRIESTLAEASFLCGAQPSHLIPAQWLRLGKHIKHCNAQRCACYRRRTAWSTSRVEWLRFSLYSAALENAILTVMEGVVLVSKAVASEEMDSGETNATRQPSGFEQKCKLTPAKMRGWRNNKTVLSHWKAKANNASKNIFFHGRPSLRAKPRDVDGTSYLKSQMHYE